MKKGLLFVFIGLLFSIFFYSSASDLPIALNLLKAKLLTLAKNLSPRKKNAFQPKFEKKKIEDADLFINHLKMLFELKSKEHFQLNLPQLKVSNMTDNQLSQSEINLNFFKDKNFNYKDHIRKILTESKIDKTKFGEKFVNFFGEPFFGESLIKKNVDETVDLMFRIIEKERGYSQCYVFYHGMNSEIAILSFVYRAIYSWFAAEPRMNNVIVRILNDDFEEFEYAKTKETESMTPIQRFLEKYKKHLFNYDNSHSCEHCGGKSLQQGDKLPIITKLLLSLNIALFGNIWRKSDSEATYDYFLTDYSYANIKVKERLKEIFEKFKFSQKFIDKIIETYKTHMEKTGGQILQIFIDKNIVDQYVYISKAVGFPYVQKNFNPSGKNEKMPKNLKFDGDQRPSPSSVLEQYLEDPKEFGHEKHSFSDGSIPIFDLLQARLLVLPSLFADQEHVKIFRYTAKRQLTAEQEKALEDDLSKIFEDVFKDWIKKYLEDAKQGKKEKVEGVSRYPLDIMADLFYKHQYPEEAKKKVTK